MISNANFDASHLILCESNYGEAKEYMKVVVRSASGKSGWEFEKMDDNTKEELREVEYQERQANLLVVIPELT